MILLVVSPLASVVYVRIPVKDMHLMMWSVSETKVPCRTAVQVSHPFYSFDIHFHPSCLVSAFQGLKTRRFSAKKTKQEPLWYACQQKKILRSVRKRTQRCSLQAARTMLFICQSSGRRSTTRSNLEPASCWLSMGCPGNKMVPRSFERKLPTHSSYNSFPQRLQYNSYG